MLAFALFLSTAASASEPHAWLPRAELRELAEPGGVAFGKDGSLYVSETGAHRISVFDRSGRLSRRFGRFGRGAGDLDRPHGVALARDGSVYVVDTGNQRVQVFAADGTPLRAWGRRGLDPGEFVEPLGIAVGDTRVYVADGGGSRVQAFDLAGKFLFYVWSHGHKPGQLGRPADVAIDPAGGFYVSDSENCRILNFDENARFVRGWGDRGSRSGLLSEPLGMACAAGVVYVADSNNERIVEFDPAGEVLLEWSPGNRPSWIALSPEGDSLVSCDALQDRCRLFARSPGEKNESPSAKPHFGGILASAGKTLLLGERSSGALLAFDLGDGPPHPQGVLAGFGFEVAEVVRQAGIDIDQDARSALVSDEGGGRLLFFQLNPGEQGGRFSRSLSFDLEELGPRLASWHLDPLQVLPGAVVRDREGTIFVVDLAASRIVVLDRELRVVRSWGGWGDVDGRFVEPVALAWSESQAILYVVDSGRRRVQAFDATGRLRAAWGSRGRKDGAFEEPIGVAVGRDGSVYVLDRGLRRVQRFTAAGGLSKGFGRKSSAAGFVRPEAIAVDERSRVLVADPGRDRVFFFSPEGRLTESHGPEILAAALAQRPALPPLPATVPSAADGFSDPIRSSEGSYVVRYRTEPSPIPLNEPFSMEVLVQDARDPSKLSDELSLEVDARMLAHRHGMSRTPKVRAVWEEAVPGHLASYVLENPALGKGRYRVQGMLFHMPGVWTIDFDLTRWAITERAQVDLSLD